MSKAKTQNGDSDVSTEDIGNVERGDVIVIDGKRYPVFRLNSGLRSLFNPDHPDVVTPGGEVKSLAVGAISETDNRTALAFGEDIEDTDEDNPPTENDCLTVGLDSVEIRDGGENDILSLLPATDTRECPQCENDSGTYHFGDRDGQHVREARKCTDCDTYYTIDREIPDETATVRTRSHNGEWGEPVELSGIYREVVSSRFDLDPRTNAKEGFFSPQEVTEFIRGKTAAKDSVQKQFGYVTGGSRHNGNSVTWRDDRMDQKMEVTFRPVRD